MHPQTSKVDTTRAGNSTQPGNSGADGAATGTCGASFPPAAAITNAMQNEEFEVKLHMPADLLVEALAGHNKASAADFLIALGNHHEVEPNRAREREVCRRLTEEIGIAGVEARIAAGRGIVNAQVGLGLEITVSGDAHYDVSISSTSMKMLKVWQRANGQTVRDALDAGVQFFAKLEENARRNNDYQNGLDSFIRAVKLAGEKTGTKLVLCQTSFFT